MTADELKKRFPRASAATLRLNGDNPALAPRLRPEQPQPSPRPHQVADLGRKEEGPRRFGVVVTRFSTGTLDYDNLVRSVKEIVDCLRESGYIDGDSEREIELFVFQQKVKIADRGTLVEIIPLPNKKSLDRLIITFQPPSSS